MALVAAVALCASANAAQPAKSKAKPKAKPAIPRTYEYDGRYSGVMKVTRELSGPNCRDIPVENFVINGGTIVPDSGAASLKPVFDGVVTDAGFISGHVRIAESTVAFEGRAEPMGMVKVISGGVLDDASKCSWIVNLTIE
ncbi:MAG: hypothetical protein K1X51_00560 [Rhodospirillaceae bacterium]|nr:hypothetical protein [Rhodospirillaceae bacterium]